MGEEVCSEKGCCAIAGPTGQCSTHAAGYRQNVSGAELRCGNCRRLVLKGHWYRFVTGGGIQHIKPCAAHPDVVREREKAAHP